MIIKSNIALMLLAAALPVMTRAAAPRDVTERSFNIPGGGTLRMDVDRGPIHIITGNSDTVNIRVVREVKRTSEKKAREILDSHTITFDQNGNSLDVRAEAPRGNHFFRRDPLNNLHVDYEVTIPPRFNLDLHTRGGNLIIDSFQGSLNGKTDGGTVTLADATGDMNVTTGGGNVVFGRIQGDVHARTGGGGISIKSAGGSVEAHSGGGPINVSEAMNSVSAHTGGGNISVAFTQQPKSKSILKTGGGNVSVSLADSLALDLNARTGGGRIHSDFQGDGNKDRTRLVVALNGGGPELVVETGGGNVQINRP